MCVITSSLNTSKRMAEPFQLLKKSQPKHSYAPLIVYALRLFVYRLRLRLAPLYEWVQIWYVGSLWSSQAVLSIQLEHNTGQDHLRSSGKKGQPPKQKSWYGTAINVFMSDFRKEHEKWPKNTLKNQNRQKKSENGQIWYTIRQLIVA